MSDETERKPLYGRVRDRSGKEYICPLDTLRDPAEVTEEELKQCLDSVEGGFSDSEVRAIIKSDLAKE
ncbi:hypothetical protein [Desulfomonile tiedjei]|uniref:Uncharacterized protein n=1 Tax=Desulfomonile tiedjei (strain ATCC 49306 / DSM 6799 / DCB-1) TaxID=706587 RepID=I4CEA1_DESTA|nr:hypothetical protein [Desulfomonile tiedjei]AFM27892.1 hypothetical protein Desti_5303 [Desulfomonile tiedjei DSM 6799]